MTIVEVVVASVLFLAVAFGILGVVDYSGRETAQIQARTEAVALAGDVLTRAETVAFDDLSTRQGAAVAVGGFFGASTATDGAFVVERGREFEVQLASCTSEVAADGSAGECVEESEAGDLREITATVRWTRPRAGRVELKRLLKRPIPAP